MATWRVETVIAVSGTVEADTAEEASALAAEAIVDEAVADIGSYDGTWEQWLRSKAERALSGGQPSTIYPEDE